MIKGNYLNYNIDTNLIFPIILTSLKGTEFAKN